MNAIDADAAADKVCKWLSSPGGIEELKKIARESVDFTDRLQQARQIDPQMLMFVPF